MSIRDEVSALLKIPIEANGWESLFARINVFGRPSNNERRQMLLIIFKKLEEIEKELELQELLKDEPPHNTGVIADGVVRSHIEAHSFEKDIQSPEPRLPLPDAGRPEQTPAASVEVKGDNPTTGTPVAVHAKTPRR